jgi:hypothetical protein
MTEKPNSPRTVRRRGVTLIEAVLYIAIALALIVGGLVFYQQASLQSRFNYVTRAMSAVFAEARTLNDEMNGAAYANLEDLLFARGSIPSELWDAARPSGQRLRFPFGTAGANLTGFFLPTGESVYDLTLRNIDKRMCARLVRSTPQGETVFASGFFGGSGSFVTDDLSSSAQVWMPINVGATLSDAGTACTAADVNNNGLVTAGMIFRTRD